MNNLSPKEKAAILMIAFGEELAAEIFKNLDQAEVRKLAATMKNLQQIDEQTVHEILMEFQNTLSRSSDKSAYTDRVLHKAFSKDLMTKLGLGNSPVLPQLGELSVDQIARFVANEHPQTTAVIFAHLEPQKLAGTLKLLDPERQTSVLMRMSKLESVAPEVLLEIQSSLEDELRQQSQSYHIDGLEKVAKMLALLPSDEARKMLQDIKERDPKMAAALTEQMFTFEDIGQLPETALRYIISKTPTDRLQLALRGADQQLLDRIYSNMSERAAERLQEDIEAGGKKPLEQIQEARRLILNDVKAWEESGLIDLGREETV